MWRRQVTFRRGAPLLTPLNTFECLVMFFLLRVAITTGTTGRHQQVRDDSVLRGPGGVREGDIVRAVDTAARWPAARPISATQLSEFLKVCTHLILHPSPSFMSCAGLPDRAPFLLRSHTHRFLFATSCCVPCLRSALMASRGAAALRHATTCRAR